MSGERFFVLTALPDIDNVHHEHARYVSRIPVLLLVLVSPEPCQSSTSRGYSSHRHHHHYTTTSGALID